MICKAAMAQSLAASATEDSMLRFRKSGIYSLTLSLLITSCIINTTALAQSTRTTVTDSLPYSTEPAVSPDRSEVAFVSGGDIWTVPTAGGEARLLVSNPANESRPLYSPDGKRMAFISNRTGNGDIYVLALDTGDLKRLTYDDTLDQLDAWSRDGRWVFSSSPSRDIAGMNDIFRVSVEGGTPMQTSADRYTNEYWAAPSPDGTAVAFTARGITSSQWWRKGHSHLDESERWVMHDTAKPSYERITEGGAKEMWPMWNGEGRALFYVSDRRGAPKKLSGAPFGENKKNTPVTESSEI